MKYLDLANGLFMEVNPIPVKTALNMMGKEVGPFRLPLYEMTQAHQAQLWQLLQQAGVTIDPDAQYSGSYQNPNDQTPDDDVMDADFEEMD